MKKIKIEDYNPKWAHAFNELKKAYLEHIREDLVIEHDLFLLSDEVYREFCYDGKKHYSALELEGIVIVISLL